MPSVTSLFVTSTAPSCPLPMHTPLPELHEEKADVMTIQDEPGAFYIIAQRKEIPKPQPKKTRLVCGSAGERLPTRCETPGLMLNTELNQRHIKGTRGVNRPKWE